MVSKFFGPRVIITPVSEKHEGLIVLPPGAGRHNYILGRVLYLGDGKVAGSDKVTEFQVTGGDTVLIQTNDFMVQSCSFTDHAGNLCLNVHEGDIIAKMSSLVIKLETFQVVGHWVLVQPFQAQRKSVLVLPDTAKEPTSEFTRFKLVQLGALCALKPTIGNEVIIDKGRINPIQLQSETYFYMNESCMLGEVIDDGKDEKPVLGEIQDTVAE
jgi:co-chaperonin GroES (HSP10)